MGICASCLGLNRHPSQDNRETDALLGDQQIEYGSAEVTQPDEEELAREREALDHITSEATDNMIDTWQPGTSEVSQHLAHTGGNQRPDSKADSGVVDEETEENAWLQSVQASGADDLATTKGMGSGLVMDFGQLRDESTPRSAKKTLKSKLMG